MDQVKANGPSTKDVEHQTKSKRLILKTEPDNIKINREETATKTLTSQLKVHRLTKRWRR